MRVDIESYPYIMTSVLTNAKLFVQLKAVGADLVDMLHNQTKTLDKVSKSGAIYHTTPDLITFANQYGVTLEKHVAYDVDSGTLRNITEDEYNLLIQL